MRKILLVDDDPHILELLTERLKANSFEILSARSGEECIEKAQAYRPDLVLIDLVMPGMNGGESVRILRSNGLTKDIPVVFLTASVTPEDDQKNINVDGHWYGVIAKPFDALTLINGINKHLTKPSQSSL